MKTSVGNALRFSRTFLSLLSSCAAGLSSGWETPWASVCRAEKPHPWSGVPRMLTRVLRTHLSHVCELCHSLLLVFSQLSSGSKVMGKYIYIYFQEWDLAAPVPEEPPHLISPYFCLPHLCLSRHLYNPFSSWLLCWWPGCWYGQQEGSVAHCFPYISCSLCFQTLHAFLFSSEPLLSSFHTSPLSLGSVTVLFSLLTFFKPVEQVSASLV